MKIRTKLFLAFLLLLGLTTAVQYTMLARLRQISGALATDIPFHLEELRKRSAWDGTAQVMRFYQEALMQSARNYVLTQDKRWQQRYYAYRSESDEAFQHVLEGGDSAARQIFGKVRRNSRKLDAMEQEAMDLTEKGRPIEAIRLLDSEIYEEQKQTYWKRLETYFTSRGASIHKSFNVAALDVSILTVKKAGKEALGIVQRSIYFTLVFLLVVFLIGMVSSIFIGQSIVRPLLTLIRQAERISKGDFSFQIPVTSDDEIGRLQQSFLLMASQLKESYEDLEKRVRDRTQELEDRTKELEQFNQTMVGRELKMIELKREINRLSKELGQNPPYDLSFLERKEDEKR